LDGKHGIIKRLRLLKKPDNLQELKARIFRMSKSNKCEDCKQDCDACKTCPPWDFLKEARTYFQKSLNEKACKGYFSNVDADRHFMQDFLFRLKDKENADRFFAERMG
jgi:hypothetical protein